MYSPFHDLKPLVVLLVLLLVCAPSVVFAVSLSSSWTYRESVSGSHNATREIRQNYSFGVGPTLTYKPSHALTANASVGYTQTNGVSNQGSRTGRTVTPTAGLTLMNDLFSVRLSGNTASTESDNGDWTSSTNWNATLNSQWSVPYVPRLFLSYGQVGGAEGIVTPETQNKDFGAGVDWDLNLAELSYRYRQSSSASQPTNQSHFVKLETGGRFWDNRIAVSLSQQAQFESQELSGGALGETTDLPGSSSVRYAVSTNAAPVDFSCNPIQTAGVDCLKAAPISSTDPLIYTALSYVQIEIAPASQPIGAVEISFDVVNLGDDDGTAGTSWVLYSQNGSGIWSGPLSPALPGVPTSVVDRVRIEIPETAQFAESFLLVSQRTSAGQIISVADFEVFPLQPGGSNRTSRSYQTNAGIQLRLSETLSSSLSLTYEREEAETEGINADAVNTDKLTTSGNLSWRPFSFLTASVGASEHRELELGVDQQLNRNYSLAFSIVPLTTMNISLGVQLNERYGDELEDQSIDMGQKTLETLTYSLSGKAQIYPDLSASFNLTSSEGQRWEKVPNPVTGRFLDNTGQFIDSSGQSARVDLNAKLYKNLTADLITRYGQSESRGIVSESGSAELGLRLRLSELLLIRGSYRTVVLGTDAPDALSLRLQARLLSTDKTRLEAQLSHTQAEEMVEMISLNGSWLVSKNMSLIGRGGYSFGESNNYNLTLDLRIGI